MNLVSYRLRLLEGEAAGDCLCESMESPWFWNSAEVPWDRVSDVESGISVKPFIFKSLAVSRTYKKIT